MKNFFKKLCLKFKLFLANPIHYICGSENLPAPLPKDEESEAIAMLETNPNKAKKRLIEHNLRLVVYIARRFENTGINIEDLISIGSIGLIKGINTFKADKNIKLATYASRCIENEILMHLRKIANQKTEVSLDEPLKSDAEGGELLLADLLGTDDNITEANIEQETDRQILMEALNTLDPREKEIMCLRFGLHEKAKAVQRDEFTQKEVAQMLGISQSYISRLEKRILVELKHKFNALSDVV